MPMTEVIRNERLKGLHGWYPGRRECTAERLLANPYNGCSHDCLACYAGALPGEGFRNFNLDGSITAWVNFPAVVAYELDRLDYACALYLSPVADPCQPVEKELGLTEATVRATTERGLPVDLVSKALPSPAIMDMLAQNRHSLLQFSLPTADEGLRRRLMHGGATVPQLVDTISRAAAIGIYTVIRIDPIYPYLTDDADQLSCVVAIARDCGARHIIASVLDLPLRIVRRIYSRMAATWDASMVERYRSLYTERIGSYLHAREDYRREIFSRVRELATAAGMTFALCMEFERDDAGKPVGMNREFATTANCEGQATPVYRRRGAGFVPAAECDGACLTCTDARCGIDELALGKRGVPAKGIGLADWRRWSKTELTK
jgi:DNA repair photolyase